MMLESNYIRELNHNYLVLSPPTEYIEENFETEIIKQNSINGLLEFDIRYYDGKQMLFYEISSKQSIENLYASSEMDFEIIRQLINGIYRIILLTEEYLISINNILLDPNYIFFDMGRKELSLVFCPGYNKNAKNSFSELAEYLLNKVDHRDEKAVILAYKIYKNTRTQNFILEEIVSIVQECQCNEKITEYNSNKINSESKTSTTTEEFVIESVKISNNEMNRKDFEKEEKEAAGVETGKSKNEKDDIFITLFGEADNSEHTDKNYFEILKQNFLKEKNSRILLVISIALIMILILTTIVWYFQIIKISLMLYLKIQGSTIFFLIISILFLMILNRRKKTKTIEEQYEITNKRINEEEFKEKQADKIEISDFLVGNDFYDSQEESYENGNTILLSGESEIKAGAYLTRNKNGKEEYYKIECFPYTIGKLAGNVNLELEEGSISRLHARLFQKNGKTYLEDLNSLNGTYKNGMRLFENDAVHVESEDEISFAKIKFTYH